jgi:hypothetical protein
MGAAEAAKFEKTNPKSNKCTTIEKFHSIKNKFGRKNFVEHQMVPVEQGSR